ncbi:MAG: Tfp pilus assembly protein FimT/FimU [Thermodesulfovibrionales bacterium]
MVKRVERERMRILRTGIYNRATRGFTLLELLVVIFVVSLFLAISAPSFTGLESNEIRSEAKKIASILRYLNDSAMAKKEERYLIVNLQDNSVTYSAEDGEKRERLEYLRAIYLGTRGEINSGEVKVIFTPLGAGEFMRFYLGMGLGLGTITDKTGDSQTFVVELNPLSGRVKIGERVNG